MEGEHVVGAIFVLLFILIVFIFGCIGVDIERHNIQSDCIDFGKFKVKGEWYICKEVSDDV